MGLHFSTDYAIKRYEMEGIPMANEAKRFKQTETMMTAVLIAATVFFIIYLIAAGSGVIWLKALMAIITI